MNFLFLITARGGSKRIPNKNIKPLGKKPLIYYSIDVARKLTDDQNICVSTDSQTIIDKVTAYGLEVPFKRPDNLASDTAGSYEVLLHAIDHYESLGKTFDAIVLLQPTSPFRTEKQVAAAMALYNEHTDMVVSVMESDANPYYNLFEENRVGFLEKSKKGDFERIQDCPKVYAYTGSIYVINIVSLKQKHINAFTRVRKYVTDDEYFVDLDTAQDWAYAEFLLEKAYIQAG